MPKGHGFLEKNKYDPYSPLRQEQALPVWVILKEQALCG
jgi:hypothetical protein